MNSLFKSMAFSFLLLWTTGSRSQEISVIPNPKETDLVEEKVCLENMKFFTAETEVRDLQSLLREEFYLLTGRELSVVKDANMANITAEIDEEYAEEEYQIEFGTTIKMKGGSYDALALASITLLQNLNTTTELCWNKGVIYDRPTFNFRSLLIDLARRKHDVATIKRVIALCRWYKINYLQLHLTDEHAFTIPSKAYPHLSTEGWVYSREELEDLIAFAEKRGVELIPELEVPGHAGQLVQQMPEVFGFSDPDVHPYTIHMGRDRVYQVLDTLIGEVAEIFHTSEFIHIGGDEANFSGMEKDPEIQRYLEKYELENMEELYWHFLNRMNALVKKHGKKTIVWEGFSKEGNEIIDKDITVMAWESKYQLPQDLLAAGFKTINVSWKPLYVVNERKWSPEEIFDWNIYRWENWVPSIPSYDPIQLETHPNLIGASMASWDQPAYTEVSSLRKRIPAFMEEVWNHGNKLPLQTFIKRLAKTDLLLNKYLSPVEMETEGLSFPEHEDGHQDEQTWFDDEVVISLSASPAYEIRYSTEGSPVTLDSPEYHKPLIFKETTDLRYRAFRNSEPIGLEMLEHFELHPLTVKLTGEFAIPPEDRWDTPQLHIISLKGPLTIEISASRKGEIKYVLGHEKLDNTAQTYTAPISLKKDALVKAGLFVNGEQVGETWKQNFRYEKK